MSGATWEQRHLAFKHHTLGDVIQAMRSAALAHPRKVDPAPPTGGIRVPYLDQKGHPGCLVAEVLHRMGVVPARIQKLDRDSSSHGQTPTGGVRFLDSVDPLIERIHWDGRALLAHLQHRQERCGWVPWAAAIGIVLNLDQYDRRWAPDNLDRIVAWRRELGRQYAQALTR